MKRKTIKRKKQYSQKEVDLILDRAASALSDLGEPKLVSFNDKPSFNGRECYHGWLNYLLTGKIDDPE